MKYHVLCGLLLLHLQLLSVRLMAQSTGGKKLIQIDISADTVCPWCFVGKKNLDLAMASSQDQYDFKVKWHPFFLDRSSSTVGVKKEEFLRAKLGSRYEQLIARMTEIFRGHGMEYDMCGLTGNSLESHRILHFAGQLGDDEKQHKLAEELMFGYFSQGKYIGDKDFLIASAEKVGVEGAAEFLEDPNKGLQELNEDFRKYSSNISGVPHYVINGKHELSGGQPPETFIRVFEAASADADA